MGGWINGQTDEQIDGNAGTRETMEKVREKGDEGGNIGRDI